MGRVEHDLTDDQWSALQDAWGGCAYCGVTDRPLQRDCVLALSRGGRYTLLNIVPACGSCNASKCNAEVTAWLRRKRLDERSFLVRHHEIASNVSRCSLRQTISRWTDDRRHSGGLSATTTSVSIVRSDVMVSRKVNLWPRSSGSATSISIT